MDVASFFALGVEVAAGVDLTAVATITRPKSPPDPLTGVQSGADVSQTVDVVQYDARQMRRRGDAWASASVAVFCAANVLSFEPKVGDKVQWGGKTMRLTARDDFAPAGVTVGYILGLG